MKGRSGRGVGRSGWCPWAASEPSRTRSGTPAYSLFHGTTLRLVDTVFKGLNPVAHECSLHRCLPFLGSPPHSPKSPSPRAFFGEKKGELEPRKVWSYLENCSPAEAYLVRLGTEGRSALVPSLAQSTSQRARKPQQPGGPQRKGLRGTEQGGNSGGEPNRGRPVHLSPTRVKSVTFTVQIGVCAAGSLTISCHSFIQHCLTLVGSLELLLLYLEPRHPCLKITGPAGQSRYQYPFPAEPRA